MRDSTEADRHCLVTGANRGLGLEFVRQLLVRGERVVANLSSEIGSIARRDEFRTPSYAIGKAAQNMGSVLLARALAPRGIRVVALHPGWVRTDMGGAQATLAPAEAVAALLDVIDRLGPGQSGVFLDPRGQRLPW